MTDFGSTSARRVERAARQFSGAEVGEGEALLDRVAAMLYWFGARR
jgi:hypothetical protein